MPIVRTWSQLRPLRLPVSHTTARWASKISARVSRYCVTADEHRADADADEHEAVRRHAAASRPAGRSRAP